MFALGPLELTLIVLIVLLLFGAKRIQMLFGSVGQGIRNLRTSIRSDDVQTLPEERDKGLR